MIERFLQYLQYEKNYSLHTVLSYHNDMKQFLVFLSIDSSEFDPNTITSSHIQKWILSLMSDAEISARTLSRKISTLKSFWRFLLLNGYVHQNPTLKIVLPKAEKALPAFLKEGEMNSLLDDTFLPEDFEKVRNMLILKMFYLTGVRRSELINVKDTDVDYYASTLKVLGKRNKERIIPLTTDFCEEIKRYIVLRDDSIGGAGAYLFVRKNGEQMYSKLIYNIVHKSISDVSPLHKRSPHVLRHTFATSILNNGGDINAVKELLGHSSLAATQVYTHTSFEELHKIYKQAHPRAK